MIHFKCGCGQKYRTPEANAGREFTCKICMSKRTVIAAENDPGPLDIEVPSSVDFELDVGPEPKPKQATTSNEFEFTLKRHDPVMIALQTIQAFDLAAKRRSKLMDPMVSEGSPYLLWSATHDGRVRPDHLVMESRGQNGTAVYRLDDPIWRKYWPPIDFGCRCVLISLSIEDAARHGSHEATEWMRTGRSPMKPEWAKKPYLFKQSKIWLEFLRARREFAE